MTQDEKEMAVKQFINEFKRIYFTGSFSEGAIKNDLHTKKLLDICSGSNALWEKKQFYFKNFEDNTALIDKCQSLLPYGHELIYQLERCKVALKILREVVESF